MNPVRADKVTGYVTALHALKEDDRPRSLKARAGTDFASNDYLALASAPRMKNAVLAALEAGTPIGAEGSRLLRGCEEHDSLEAEAAKFFWAETTFFFGGGHFAN